MYCAIKGRRARQVGLEKAGKGQKLGRIEKGNKKQEHRKTRWLT
jgi:hypothetical protein